MAVTLNEHVYGFTGTGKLVITGHVTETEVDLFPVGGKIFYINPNSQEQVEFFDQYGDPITDVGVGSTPYAYRIIHADPDGIDKYYVYYDAVYTSKKWAPTDYQSTAIGGTSQAIGKGKANTQIAMAYADGAMVASGTVWYQIKAMRDNLYGGCDDWFLPSKNELEELRKAITFQVVTTSDDPVILPAGPVTGGSVAGTADGNAHYKDYNTTRTCYPSATKFLDNYLWSSSEYSATNAWAWYSNTQFWNSNLKSYYYSVVGVRAF